MKVHYTVLAIKMLEEAGFQITPADGVPGLWNIHGLARDVTTNQLRSLAEQHGHWPFPLAGPSISFQQVS